MLNSALKAWKLFLVNYIYWGNLRIAKFYIYVRLLMKKWQLANIYRFPDVFKYY